MTKKIALALILFLSLTHFAVAQGLAIVWQKSIGGYDDDIPYCIRQTADGGYIIAGSSASTDGDVTGNHGSINANGDATGGDFDYWIVKTNSTGTIEWQKSLGGTYNDIAYDVKQTSDGGYIIAGSSESIDGDVTGHHINSMAYPFNDYWVVKLNSLGALEWQKSYGGTGRDGAHSIQQTIDGGYIVAGYSKSNNGDVMNNHQQYDSWNAVWNPTYDVWVIKLDSIGGIKWEKSLGGSLSDGYPGIYGAIATAKTVSIQQAADGGYIVVSNSESTDGDISETVFNHYDYWVVKLTSTGGIEWDKSYGGSENDYATAVQQTTDGGYIVVGATPKADGDVAYHHGTDASDDYWVLKLAPTGEIEWQKSIGGSTEDIPFSVQQTTDGGYIIGRHTASNDGDVTCPNAGGWVIKLNSTGNIQWQNCFNSPYDHEIQYIQQTTDEGYILVAKAWAQASDYWVIKLGPDGSTSISDNTNSTFSVFPNPANTILNIEVEEPVSIKVINVLGEIVAVETLRKGTNSINASFWASGLYIIQPEKGENLRFVKN